MKASLKLRDDGQKPLLRAKIPLTIVGLPFFSGVSAGGDSTSDLQLDLGTAFTSGPSLRLSYRPNSSSNPFSLSLKSGAGPFGSPSASPISVHVDFNLLGKTNPSFSFLFKPQIGDFCIRKVTTSAAASALAGDREETDGFAVLDLGARAGSAVERALSGVELTARSVLPLKNAAVVSFRWGVKVPGEIRRDFTEKRRVPMPLLVMNKISFEYVGAEKKAEEKNSNDDPVKACLSVRDQLDSLKMENGMLRKAVEELRMEVVGGKGDELLVRKVGERDGMKVRENEVRIGGKVAVATKNGKRNGKKDDIGMGSTDGGDVNAELRKALMEAAGGSA